MCLLWLPEQNILQQRFRDQHTQKFILYGFYCKKKSVHMNFKLFDISAMLMSLSVHLCAPLDNTIKLYKHTRLPDKPVSVQGHR